jgi:hypothetical protein
MATPSNAQIQQYLDSHPGQSGRQAISAINNGWKPDAAAETVMGGVAVGKTPVAEVAPKAATPAPVTPPPVQQTTPVAQVAPKSPESAAVPFSLKGGNASLFSNIDPNTGLPIVQPSCD